MATTLTALGAMSGCHRFVLCLGIIAVGCSGSIGGSGGSGSTEVV